MGKASPCPCNRENMSYDNPPDTKPKSPFKEDTQPITPAQPQEPVWQVDQVEAESSGGGPGCFTWGCVTVIGLAFAVVIVVLSGAAGWTAGRRQADANATATLGAEINEQLNRIPADIANRNLQLLDIRLRYLSQLTPGVPQMQEFIPTATALYVQSQPTVTPTSTATATPLPEATAEAAEIVITPSSGGQFDLAAMLDEARTNVETGRFAAAFELLDAIAALDKDFQPQLVRQLTAQALNGQARAYFNANQPAQGVLWATRAEDLGVLEGDLSYELYAATLYLDATSAVGLSYPQAIASLQKIFALGQGRYYEQARQLLFQQYVAYGDYWASVSEYCPALPLYNSALGVFNDAGVAAKRDNANTQCSQATPTLGPGVTPGATAAPGEFTGEIAPVGQQ